MNSEKPTIVCPFIIPIRYDGRDLEVYVDHEDAHLLIGRKLTMRKSGNTYYAFLDGVPVHRLIMGITSNYPIHHVSKNGLDNRRCNLRFVSAQSHADYHNR